MAQLLAVVLLVTMLWVPTQAAQAATPGPAVPAGPQEPPAPEAHAAPGSELVELRDRQSASFTTDKPGVIESKVSSGPVHYQDGQRWERIDRTLRPKGPRFGNLGRNDFELSVGKEHRDRELVRFDSKRGHVVAYGMEGARPGAAAPDPAAGGQQIVYRSIVPHVDLRLRSLADSVEEVLVLNSARAPSVYRFPLQLTGVTARVDETDGSVVYEDGDGKPVFRTPRPWMMDTAYGDRLPGQTSLDASYHLSEGADGGQVLELRLSQQWLQDPARVYPVKVDPTVRNTSSSRDGHPFFYSDTSYASHNPYSAYTTDAGLYIGKDTDGHRYRAVLQFGGGDKITPGDGQHYVHSATFGVYQAYSFNCQREVYAKRVTASWDASPDQWAPQLGPPHDASGGAVLSPGAACPANDVGWLYFDVTGTARLWENDTNVDNYGLALLGSFNLNDTARGFYSQNHWDASIHPYLSVVWENNVPTVTDGHTPSPGSVLTAPPTRLGAVYRDADYDWGMVRYYLATRNPDGSGSLVRDWETGPYECNGCYVSSDIDRALPPGQYQWWVNARDVANTSPWAGPFTFTVEAPPAAPAVSSSTHPSSTAWYPTRTASFGWEPPASQTGIQRYAYALSTSSTTLPSTTDTTRMTTAETVTQTATSDGQFYFHVRAQNNAGQWGSTAHYPFKVDGTKPAAPAVTSPTHPDPSKTYSARDITVDWSARDTSGISSYAWVLDTNPVTYPASTSGQQQTSASYTREPGEYWFHVKARNGAGSWSGTTHFRIRIADPEVAPEVSKVVSAAQGSTGQATGPAEAGSPAPAAHAAGEAVTYTVTVRNPNTTAMTLDKVTDTVPAAARLSGLVSQAGAPCLSCTLNGLELTLPIPGGSIPAGESVTFTYAAVLTGNELDCLTGVVNSATTSFGGVQVGDSTDTTVCGGGLGVESWWSYVSSVTGSQSQAMVNAANGNLVVSATDSTAVQGRGRLGYVLRRTYNSQEPTVATLPGSFGAGWLLNVGFSGDLAGTGVTPTGLLVPTLGQAAQTITEPLAVTLADRDGTRHTFTPKLGLPAVNALTAGDAVQPTGLTAPDGYSTICVATAYDAPPGVHLGLWRYVAVQPSVTSTTDPNVACSRLSATSTTPADPQVVLGYAAVRPDRLRTEFAATGQLLSMVDGSGSRLNYVYDGVGQDTGVVSGPLLFVYEPRSSDGQGNPCTISRNLLGAPSLTPGCRSFSFTYTGQAFTDGVIAGTGEATTEVRDPAGRVTRYEFRKVSLPAGVQGPAMLLTAVVNPPETAGGSADRVTYRYQGDPADGVSTDCGGSRFQLCEITDARGATTTMAYTRPSADPASSLAGLGRVASLTDRRDTATTFGYRKNSDGTTSTVTLRGQSQERTFSAIDGFGRVGKVVDVDAAGSGRPVLHDTTLNWDSDSAACPDSPAGRDNNLCAQVRAGGTSPDEHASWAYDDSGMVLRQRQLTSAPASSGTPAQLDTTFGYVSQHWRTSGGATTADRTTIGGGNHTAPTAAPADTLFTVVDRTEQLSARGNQPGQVAVDRYRTVYAVDNATSAQPNAVPAGEVCAAAAFNTGLVCSVSVPVAPEAAGSADAAVTEYGYDTFGQRLRMRTPNAVASGGPSYTYSYVGRDRRDLSGTVSADGWLLGVTDPAGKFVAFGHDAAGNVVRTWDRNATAGRTLGEFPGPLTAPPTTRFAQTLYATGSSDQAIARPWRWAVADRTPMGDSTARCLDAHGNVRLERPARGSAGQPITDCAAALSSPGEFDVLYDTANTGKAAPDDRPVSVLQPEQRAAGQNPTTLGYDRFGNPTTVTDPRGIPTATIYDAVNRPIEVRTVRAATAAELPNGPDPSCPARDGFASVCTTTTSYDSVDNPVTVVDADGKTSQATYNGVHWKTATVVDGSAPDGRRDAAAGTAPTSESLRTEVRYDADGHATTVCSPRQFGPDSDTSGACTDDGAFSRHYAYDPAGRMISETGYRAANSPALVTRYGYDLSGNQTAVTDANGHTTTSSFDALDRPAQVVRPRSTGTSFATTLGYDAVGNRTSVVEQLNTVGGSRTDAFSYDAANRLVDSVTGADNPDANAGGTATGAANVRTRQLYDPDGRAVGQYAPRAFVASLTDPDERFLTWTDVDRNGRPVATFTPRHDASTGTAGPGDSQASECPTGVQPATRTGGAQPYPAGVGVCVSRMSYDSADRVSVMTLPTAGAAQPADTSRKLSLGYTADGLRATVTGPNPAGTGTVDTTMDYDGSGRPVRISMPGGAERTTTMSYTADGLLAASTAPPVTAGDAVRTTRYGYDLNGQQIAVIDPLGQRSTTAYTADGLTASTADPAGNTTSYTHDAVGNVVRVLDPVASKAEEARAADPTQPPGVPTVYTYTADDLLAAELRPTRADGNRLEVAWSYDGAGRKTTQAMRTVSGAGPGTDAEADPALRTQVADGGRQSFAYHPAGRLVTETGRNDETITTLYDPDGNPTAILDSTQDSAGATSRLNSSFYLDGLLRSSADATHTTRYGYDAAGQVTVREHGPTGDTANTDRTVFGYNDAGARTETRSTATTPANQPWSAAYDPAGRMTSETAPNGQVTSHTYHPDDSLAVKKTVADATAGAPLIAQWAYTYDALGRQLTQDHTGEAINGAEADSDHRYGYDPAGRVTVFADGPNASREHIATFDPNGNRLTYTTPGVGKQVSSYSPDNTQASSTDLAGNNPRTSSYTPFGALAADGCYSYGYDGFDRLTSTAGDPAVMACATAPSTRYAYDGLDRQRSRTELGGTGGITAPAATTGLHYDGLGTAVASETLTTGTAASSKAFTLNPAGQPLSVTAPASDPLGSPSTAYLTDDGTGTITTITGDQPTSAGSTAEPFTTCTARFDPWGTPTTTGTKTADNGTPGQRAANPCGSTTLTGTQADQGNDRFYRGERRDSATGNYQLGARTYDPSRTGFLTPDSHRNRQPIADLALGTDPLTINRYNYVNGDPLNYTDPTGHEPRANHSRANGSCKEGRCSAEAQAATDGRARDGSSQTTRSRGTRIGQAQIAHDRSGPAVPVPPGAELARGVRSALIYGPLPKEMHENPARYCYERQIGDSNICATFVDLGLYADAQVNSEFSQVTGFKDGVECAEGSASNCALLLGGALIPPARGLRTADNAAEAADKGRRLASGKVSAFDSAGVQYTEHFATRIGQRGARGISGQAALDAYNRGTRFYDPTTKAHIRYDRQTGVAVVLRKGRAHTVFEQPRPNSRWNPVPYGGE